MKLYQAVLVFAALLYAGSQARAQIDYPIGELAAETPAASIALRGQLIQQIWGGSSIVTPSPTLSDGACCYGDQAPGYYGVTPTLSKWLGFGWGYGGSPYGMWARTYYSQFPGSTCLLLVNAGHGEGYFNWPDYPAGLGPFSPTSVRDMARRFIAKGCDVALSSMPLFGENRSFAPYVGYPYPPETSGIDMHGGLASAQHKPPTGSPLKYFLDPVLGTLNYALTQRSYSKIVATGYSGGGWTSTMIAALDPRITHTYAVAGSTPLANRAVTEGDWEQYAGVSNLGVDYPDLYLMTIAEPSRRLMLMYNGADGCCFNGVRAADFASWVMSKAKAGGYGAMRVLVDPNQAYHDYATAHADAAIADFTAH